VLRDYHSEELDLEVDASMDVGLLNDYLGTLGTEGSVLQEDEGLRESAVFRDLSKPMGAITEQRKCEAVDKFATLAQQHSSQSDMQVFDTLLIFLSSA
jgi:hypothetical protein